MEYSRTFVESPIEIEEIFAGGRLGFLGMSMNNMPYTLPITYAYSNGKILFHCSPAGKKLDILRSNHQVCFTVGRQFGEFVRHPQGALCHAHSDSVVCYGIARIVEEPEEKGAVLNIFNHSLQSDAREITIDEVSKCTAVEIRLTEMTGRRERDSKSTFFRHSFQ